MTDKLFSNNKGWFSRTGDLVHSRERHVRAGKFGKAGQLYSGGGKDVKINLGTNNRSILGTKGGKKIWALNIGPGIEPLPFINISPVKVEDKEDGIKQRIRFMNLGKEKEQYFPEVVIKPNVERVANHPRNKIIIDKKLPKKYHNSIILHEFVEDRLMKAGYTYEDAHNIAESIEKKSWIKSKEDWLRYEKKVDRINSKNLSRSTGGKKYVLLTKDIATSYNDYQDALKFKEQLIKEGVSSDEIKIIDERKMFKNSGGGKSLGKDIKFRYKGKNIRDIGIPSQNTTVYFDGSGNVVDLEYKHRGKTFTLPNISSTKQREKIYSKESFRHTDTKLKKIQTKSFWIRNYEKKYPNAPKINYEHILVFQK